jgi:hypothetical protein
VRLRRRASSSVLVDVASDMLNETPGRVWCIVSRRSLYILLLRRWDETEARRTRKWVECEYTNAPRLLVLAFYSRSILFDTFKGNNKIKCHMKQGE